MTQYLLRSLTPPRQYPNPCLDPCPCPWLLRHFKIALSATLVTQGKEMALLPTYSRVVQLLLQGHCLVQTLISYHISSGCLPAEVENHTDAHTDKCRAVSNLLKAVPMCIWTLTSILLITVPLYDFVPSREGTMVTRLTLWDFLLDLRPLFLMFHQDLLHIQRQPRNNCNAYQHRMVVLRVLSHPTQLIIQDILPEVTQELGKNKKAPVSGHRCHLTNTVCYKQNCRV